VRGIAILLVVAYHAGVPGFSGGYVGVDVFFVLSGYLITGLLVSEIERTGRLDLLNFYARRARRLLPASALVLAATVVVGFAVGAPVEQREFARTAFATAAYLSNVYFARGATDYLGADAETNPLLHTWSLAVEEQFYLGWPVLVALALGAFAWQRGQPDRRRLIVVMAVVSAASFAASVWLTGTRQPWAFFLSPMRAWEFGLGALGALLPVAAAERPRVAGWLGLGGVLAAGVLFDATTPFPGWAALLPGVATVLMLRGDAAAPGTALGRVLGSRVLQESGRLSYSWYLWHWPALVFGAALLGHLSLPASLALLALSLVLAEASYRFVENPVRHHPFLAVRPSRSLVLAAVLTAAGLALALGWRGVAERAAASPAQVRLTEAVSDRASLYATDCIPGYDVTQVPDCTFGDADSGTTVVLMGDSHAAQWFPALDTLARARGWRLETLIKSACPTADIDFFYPALGRAYTECSTWRDTAFERLDALDPDLILTTHSVYYQVDSTVWREGIQRSVSRLAAAAPQVVVLRDTPRPAFDVPACLARAAWRAPWLPADDCTFNTQAALDDDIFALERQAAAAHLNVTTLDLTPAICPTDPCQTDTDGVVSYFDSNHITATFATRLAPALGTTLDAALRAAPAP
jgi:peptidoglycan/LPS O-acetylase OafA/YrhL